MVPQTLAEWTGVVSALIAGAVALGAWLGRRGREAQSDQAIRDKLDSIEGTGRDTRADVREINRKLDEDRRQLASMTTRVDGIEARVTRVEDRCERCRTVTVGGTD